MSKPPNYNEICLKIWGAIPIDIAWAIGTQIYNEAKAATINIKEK